MSDRFRIWPAVLAGRELCVDYYRGGNDLQDAKFRVREVCGLEAMYFAPETTPEEIIETWARKLCAALGLDVDTVFPKDPSCMTDLKNDVSTLDKSTDSLPHPGWEEGGPSPILVTVDTVERFDVRSNGAGTPEISEAIARIDHILPQVKGPFRSQYAAYRLSLLGSDPAMVDAIVKDVAYTWNDRPDLRRGFGTKAQP